MRFRRFIGLGLFALILAGAACAPPPSPPVRDVGKEVNSLLKLGQERLVQNRLGEAGNAYQAALKLGPPPWLKAQAFLGMARVEQAAGRLEEALNWVLRLMRETPDSLLAPDAELLAAALEKDLGQSAEATARLRRILAKPPAGLSPMQRRQATELLVETSQTAGPPLEAVKGLVDFARGQGPDIVKKASQRVSQLAGQLTSREIESLMAGVVQPQMRAALLLGLAQAQLREGSLPKAEQTVKELRLSPFASSWQAHLKDIENQLNQARTVNPRAVGLLLPLSGIYAAQGRQVRDAVQLGLGLFGPLSAHPHTLYIEDSKSDPAEAAEAVTRLVRERRVIAIIGPMGAATSLSAARRAQQLGVPLITLTQVEGITRAGEYVFQNFFTPSQQVAAVLDEATNKLSISNFAVLAPRTAYGQGFAKLIAQGVASRGGQLVETVYYDSKLTDFTKEVKKLVHLPPGSYRPGRPDSPQPVINFQALYIPDGPERVGMLAPQLAYYDVTGVTLLGTSLWHDPRLVEVAGRYLAGCVFPDAFDPRSKEPEVINFVSEFRKALGKEPNVLDAHGYDAAVLVRKLIDNPHPPRTRQVFRQALAGLKNVRGVCGELSVGLSRMVHKKLRLFTVRKGAFRPLAGEAAAVGQGSIAGGVSAQPGGGWMGPALNEPTKSGETGASRPAPASTILR